MVGLLLPGLDARDSTLRPGTAPMPLEGATHSPYEAERAVVPASGPSHWSCLPCEHRDDDAVRPHSAGPAATPDTVPFELSALVERIYQRALARYGPVDGELLAVALLEEQAGLRLRHGPPD